MGTHSMEGDVEQSMSDAAVLMIGMDGQGLDGGDGVIDHDVYHADHRVVWGNRYEFESRKLDVGFGRYDIVEVGGSQERQNSTAQP